MRRFIVLLFAVEAVVQGVCLGQAHHIGDLSVREGDWIYKTVYALAPDHSTARVSAIVAFRDPATITGDNISTVLFTRNPSPSLGWTSKAWSATQDQAETIKAIKSEFQIPDCEDWLWDVKTDAQIQEAVSAGNPESVEKGLLTSDPLSAVIPLGNIRELAVQLLSAVGYKAADVPLEKTGDPSIDCRDTTLSRMALGVETYLTFSGTDEQRELAGLAAYTPPVIPGEPERCDGPGNGNTCLQIWTWPAIGYGEIFCSDWVTHANGVTEPANVPLETCYVRNCAQLQRTTVMTRNFCVVPPTVTVSYLYRSVGYTEGCCIPGMGGTPPPVPCIPVRRDITPRPWQPTIPPIPGVDPGNDPVWPVLRPRCEPTR